MKTTLVQLKWKLITQAIRIKTFARSLFFHIYSGFPKSTYQQIQERYEICLRCEELDKEASQCTICGCNIGKQKVFLNKLAWADQECPIGKWGKVS